MRRLISVFVSLVIVCGWGAKVEEAGIAREKVMAMIRQLERLTSLNGDGSVGYEEMVRFLQQSLTENSLPRRTNSPVDDYEMFKRSSAYDFLSNDEKRMLDVMARISHLCAAGYGREAELLAESIVKDGGMLSFETKRLMPPTSYADLRRGDLVFRTEKAFLSRCFVDASTRDRRFSHVGIVLTGGVGATILTIGGDVSSIGTATSVTWSEFLWGSVDCAVYRFKGGSNVGDRIARAAEKRIGTPFDPAFDLKTKDRLYCTEMVRDCVNEAAGREVIGTSRKGDFEYVAVDDCYRNEMTKVWDCRDQKPEEKQPIQKLQSRPVVIENASTTNAPVRRTIRFIPKNR